MYFAVSLSRDVENGRVCPRLTVGGLSRNLAKTSYQATGRDVAWLVLSRFLTDGAVGGHRSDHGRGRVGIRGSPRWEDGAPLGRPTGQQNIQTGTYEQEGVVLPSPAV